jgi:cytochrome c biogenesis protein CcmG/thiol:disulfide interchange protein DsbE
MSRRRRHATRWVAGAVLLVLVVLGIVLATRTPQEATAVASPLLGRQAPGFTGTDLTTGAPVSLTALRGHYVVVNFFASWCIPCQTEAPDLSRFHYEQAHAADGADMVSVAFHDTTSTAKKFLHDNGDLWPAVSDPGGTIADRYGVTNPPTTVVINPAGRVTAVLLGPATQKNLDSFLKAARTERAGASSG